MIRTRVATGPVAARAAAYDGTKRGSDRLPSSALQWAHGQL
jgi:hypothetical protein